MYIRHQIIDPIINWISHRHQASLWIISLISCQQRKMVPIWASRPAQVGHYIRTHVSELVVFFQQMAECLDYPYSEGDEIAQQLKAVPPTEHTSESLIERVNQILSGMSDDEIVKEFYAYRLEGENSYKICIEGPLKMIDVN